MSRFIFIIFAVSRLSSIEVLPCDSASPVSTVALKLKKIDGNEEDSTINISKDDVQVLLKGTDSLVAISDKNIFFYYLIAKNYNFWQFNIIKQFINIF